MIKLNTQTKNLYFVLKNIFFNIAIFFVILIIIFSLINVLIEPQVKKNISVYQQIPTNFSTRISIFFTNLFTFNPGKIYSYELSSSEPNILNLYLQQFKWTLLFTFLIFIFSFLLGNILGIYSAYKLNKIYDWVVSILISFLAALPILIVGVLSLVSSTFIGYPSQFIANNKLSYISLIVPILICSFPTIAIFFSKSRKITSETLNSNYYLFSKTLGINDFRLLKKIIIKDIILGQLNLFFTIYIFLFTSSLLIERIFSIPGQSILISFAFQKGEIDIIMFYFTFNFILLSFLLFINHLILLKLNPSLKQNNIYFSFKKRKEINV
ncbi:ABC transporter permease subunit [Mycoplasma zalophi]|uniref:ABC transporter permease subunit n=1 Tax=Mycoplasma zalophi TaxID=191287 RepID=UPI0021C69CBA|nr:ABC transporter permease subunit [Mycoplasma zalophi]MCU4117233.1 ABC transporter permease subunit [Mycoplasma zalophi]